jgi:hypothetical protein
MGYVKYIGVATVRQITADDWAKVGVTDMETVVWDRFNGWTVPDSKFTEAAWPFIDEDKGFVHVGDRAGEQDRQESIKREEHKEAAQRAAAAESDAGPPPGTNRGSTGTSGASRQASKRRNPST